MEYELRNVFNNKKDKTMIIEKSDGTKVSSENIDYNGKVIAKCPKCECVYFSMNDFISFRRRSESAEFVCNECKMDLEDQILGNKQKKDKV